MKKSEIRALEGYFRTENEYWNEYAFDMLCETFQKGQFENPETPLKLFSSAIDIITSNSDSPLVVLDSISSEMNQNNLTDSQRLFIYEWMEKYLKWTDFEDIDLSQIKELLNSQTNLLKNKKPEYNKPLVGGIRESLKDLVQAEIEKLPKTLEDLDTIQRLNILCKLIPYVLPKVEAVHSEKGEPVQQGGSSPNTTDWWPNVL